MNLENLINQNLNPRIIINIKNKLCINILKTVDNTSIYPVHYNLNDDEIIEMLFDNINYIKEYRNCVYGIVSTNVMNIVSNNINNNVFRNINRNLNTQSISKKFKSNILKAFK